MAILQVEEDAQEAESLGSAKLTSHSDEPEISIIIKSRELLLLWFARVAYSGKGSGG